MPFSLCAQGEAEIEKAEEELKDEYSQLVDLQHELVEQVKFTKVSSFTRIPCPLETATLARVPSELSGLPVLCMDLI